MIGASEFVIHALKVIDGPVNSSGNRLIAVFDVEAIGIRISGCALVLDADGIVRAKGARGKTHKGYPVEARFMDPALSREITRRASEIYQLFTGRKVETE